LRRTLVQHEFYQAFSGNTDDTDAMDNPDLISANLFNPRHQSSIHMLNKELNAQVCDAIKV